MNLPPTPISEIDESVVEYNRARICEEAAQGIFELMTLQGVKRKQLADLLETQKPRVSLILSGEHNFQLKTLADLFLVLGRSVHITLGVDIDEMRIPIDECVLESEQDTASDEAIGEIDGEGIIQKDQEEIPEETKQIEYSDEDTSLVGKASVFNEVGHTHNLGRSYEDMVSEQSRNSCYVFPARDSGSRRAV